MNQHNIIKQVLAEQELARRNLEYYMRYIFKYHYQRPLKINWHQGFISEIMMAAFAGELPRFSIQIAPSTGKTEETVRQGFSWALGQNPRKKYAYTTYGGDLSTMVSIQTRSIVDSKPYAGLFPDTKLSKVKNKNDDWETTVEGGMASTSTGGAMTGTHYDGIMMDDPLKAIDADSIAKHKEAIDFYTGTILTRLRDKEHGFIGLIMQRLHVHDLVGYLMESEERDDWEFFTLRGTEGTTTFYDFGNFHYERPAGEALFEAHENTAQLEKMERSMGKTKYDTQYQQNPEPKEAGFVLKEWFSEIGEFDIPQQNLYIKIDPAMSTKQSADNRAIDVIGYSIDNSAIELKVMMDCWFGTWGLDEFIDYIIMAMMRYPDATVLLESSGGGLLVDQQLKKEILRRNAVLKEERRDLIKNRIIVYSPSNKISKNQKISAGIIELETGRFKFRRGANGVEQMKSEYLRFDPNKESNRDDCIDAAHSGEEHCHPKKIGSVKKEQTIGNRYKKKSGSGKWRF
ncbi:hypothetical protein [Sulfuricurvum sp.]|uniref:hypothetical protein n=1 Tax=Sulfuricurvum sp. TaxID=2025608 RepID=UPI002610816F|nr:hypothetical protein [Sulfuricurvum sp.]MDD2267481.1 hypothetical protein [Sulfuricurvum sp.]MDD2783971.1 hypothetical protein [Sulfuricurvum sp.]